jgi:hypothetical protein
MARVFRDYVKDAEIFIETMYKTGCKEFSHSINVFWVLLHRSLIEWGKLHTKNGSEWIEKEKSDSQKWLKEIDRMEKVQKGKFKIVNGGASLAFQRNNPWTCISNWLLMDFPIYSHICQINFDFFLTSNKSNNVHRQELCELCENGLDMVLLRFKSYILILVYI